MHKFTQNSDQTSDNFQVFQNRIAELPSKGLLTVEVATPDSGAGPDREAGDLESGLEVREDWTGPWVSKSSSRLV